MNINAGRCINGNLFEIKSVQVYSTAISDLFYDFVASFASAIVNEKKKKFLCHDRRLYWLLRAVEYSSTFDGKCALTHLIFRQKSRRNRIQRIPA